MATQLMNYNFELGKYAFQTRDYELATQIFSKIIMEEDAEQAEYWSWLAESLFYQAQFDSALRCWHEASKYNPKDKQIWIRISALYALMEENELAIHYYLMSEELPIHE